MKALRGRGGHGMRDGLASLMFWLSVGYCSLLIARDFHVCCDIFFGFDLCVRAPSAASSLGFPPQGCACMPHAQISWLALSASRVTQIWMFAAHARGLWVCILRVCILLGLVCLRGAHAAILRLHGSARFLFHRSEPDRVAHVDQDRCV